MSDYIVIGGGFAGLSAAAHLSASGKRVELLEASQKLGGRAYSLRDKSTEEIIDNGQHIMMGCYTDTINFFRMIGAQDNLIFQEKLKVNFLEPHFQNRILEAGRGIYPFSLAAGLLKYKALSLKNRIRLLKFFLMLPLSSTRDLCRMNIYDWLMQENQNEKILKAFWEILTAGALNTNLHKASAKVFKDVLIEISFKGNRASTIILPREGLTESYCNDASEFITNRGGKVIQGEQVNRLIAEGNKVKAIATNKRTITDFKYIISSIPFYSLKRILTEDNLIPDPGFEYSSILTVHIWLKNNKLDKPFYGLIDSEIHWIFNHRSHLTLVRSDADELMEKSKEAIFELAAKELFKYCFIEKEDITNYSILKEKRATFIPSNQISFKRPGPSTGLKNLAIAGDWTNTGLPSTIESAVKSGRLAAELFS